MVTWLARRTGFSLLALLIIFTAWRPANAGIEQVTGEELSRLLQRGVPVIDIRRAEEWRGTGIIAGSRLITAFDVDGNLDPQFAETIRASVEADKPVAIICRSGNRSAAAARILTEHMGFAQVYNVTRGLRGWLSEGRPVQDCPSC